MKNNIVSALVLAFGLSVLPALGWAKNVVEVYPNRLSLSYIEGERASFSLIQKYKPSGPYQTLQVEAFFPDAQQSVNLTSIGNLQYFITPQLAAGTADFIIKVYLEEDSWSPQMPPRKRTLMQTTSLRLITSAFVPDEPQLLLTNINQSADNKFSSVNSYPNVVIAGASFSNSPVDHVVMMNDELLAESEISVTASQIAIHKNPKSGDNTIYYLGLDHEGRKLEKRFEFVAGDTLKKVIVKDGLGSPMANAEIIVNPAGRPEIFQRQTTDSNGEASFTNVPAYWTMSYAATGHPTKGKFGASDLGDVDLTININDTPALENLDFSQGLTGWLGDSTNVSTAPVNVDLETFMTPATQVRLADRLLGRFIRSSQPVMKNLPCAPSECSLILRTAGAGDRSIRHTFVASKNNYKIQFRFKTLEVLNGYYRTSFDDTFRISYKTNSGKSGVVTGGMNSLGRGAFDLGSTSSWMDLDTDISAGETVEVIAVVRNSGDDLYDSLLQIDFNSLSTFKAEAEFLPKMVHAVSAGLHPYHDGQTKISTKVKIIGQSGDSLQAITAVAKVEGHTIPVTLVGAQPSILNVPFGAMPLESELALEFESPQGLVIPENAEVNLSLNLSSNGNPAQSIAASSAAVDLKTWPALVSLYDSGAQDPNYTSSYPGGNDWILSQHRKVVEYVAAHSGGFRELSRMNGQFDNQDLFHLFGRAANYAPTWYALSTENNESEVFTNAARRAAAADEIIQLLDDSVYGEKIKLIWADDRFYRRTGPQTDPFWVNVMAHPKASKVIRPRPGYSSFFQIIL